MKIIKKGHNEDRMHVRCKRCEAELEISSGDVKKRPTYKSVWGELFITCPCCNTDIVIEEHELTYGVQSKVYTKTFEVED